VNFCWGHGAGCALNCHKECVVSYLKSTMPLVSVSVSVRVCVSVGACVVVAACVVVVAVCVDWAALFAARCL
jgi:hypothetical protein